MCSHSAVPLDAKPKILYRVSPNKRQADLKISYFKAGLKNTMRSSKSRSRSKNNRNNRPTGNIVNRVFDSNGPEGKVRGTPQQIIDKYNQLARDAQLAGDRVATENFQQHAEHYLRLLSEAQREMEARREEQERQNRERQAERDRERAARAERQERESNAAAPADVVDPSDSPQPDVAMEVMGDSQDSGLVETPEAPKEQTKPKRNRRPRKKDDSAKDGGDAPKAKKPEPSDAEPKAAE